MISAFVAVVVLNPIYNKVLNPVIPRIDKKSKIKKFDFIDINIFLKFIIKIGDKRINTKSHLKNAISSGSISSFKNLPSTKLPDQKRTQRIKKIYILIIKSHKM